MLTISADFSMISQLTCCLKFHRRCSHAHQQIFHHVPRVLSVFTPTTPEEVYKIICSMASKTSPLDIIPTLIIKSCVREFSYILSSLAYSSFAAEKFPSVMKTALVTPLIKKPGIDLMCLILITFIPYPFYPTCLPYLKFWRNLFFRDSSHSLVTHLTIVPFSLPIAQTLY